MKYAKASSESIFTGIISGTVCSESVHPPCFNSLNFLQQAEFIYFFLMDES